jgi:signal peptidase II
MPRAIGLVLILGVMALDLATKGLARAQLRYGEPYEVLPFLDLTLGFNRGVAFGFLNAAAGQIVLLVTAAISLMFGLWFWLAPRQFTRLGLALVISGALGNFFDRLARGEVTDFLDVHVLGRHWPAFNLADTAITFGAIVLVVDMLHTREEARS